MPYNQITIDSLKRLPEWSIYQNYQQLIAVPETGTDASINAEYKVLLINTLKGITELLRAYITKQKADRRPLPTTNVTEEIQGFCDLYLYSFGISNEAKPFGLLRKLHLFINALLGNELHIPISFSDEEKALLVDARKFYGALNTEDQNSQFIYLLLILRGNLNNIALSSADAVIHITGDDAPITINTEVPKLQLNISRRLRLHAGTDAHVKNAKNKIINAPHSTPSDQVTTLLFDLRDSIAQGITPIAYQLSRSQIISRIIAVIASLISTVPFADSSRAGVVAAQAYVMGRPLEKEGLGYDTLIDILNYFLFLPSSVIVNGALGVMVLHAFFFGGLSQESWFLIIFSLIAGLASMSGIAATALLDNLDKGTFNLILLALGLLITGFIHAYGFTAFWKYVTKLFTRSTEEAQFHNMCVDILERRGANFISREVIQTLFNNDIDSLAAFYELHTRNYDPENYADPQSTKFRSIQIGLFLFVTIIANFGVLPYIGTAYIAFHKYFDKTVSAVSAFLSNSPLNMLLIKASYTGATNLTERMLAKCYHKHVAEVAAPTAAKVFSGLILAAAFFAIGSLFAAGQDSWTPVLIALPFWAIMLVLGLQYVTSWGASEVFNGILPQGDVQDFVAFATSLKGTPEQKKTVQTSWALHDVNNRIRGLSELERTAIAFDENSNGLHSVLADAGNVVTAQREVKASQSRASFWSTAADEEQAFLERGPTKSTYGGTNLQDATDRSINDHEPADNVPSIRTFSACQLL